MFVRSQQTNNHAGYPLFDMFRCIYMSLYENEIVIQSVDAHISSVCMGVVIFIVHTYSMHKFVCCGMVSTVMCVRINFNNSLIVFS